MITPKFTRFKNKNAVFLISHLFIGECIFATGDGIGGLEEYLGIVDTPELCVGMVTVQEPDATGVTYGARGQGRDKECYAEFNMTGRNDNYQWQSCVTKGSMLLLHAIQ